MNDIILAQSNTMTSTQLAELLGKQKKHINQAIKQMFQDKIDGRESLIDAFVFGMVWFTDHHLN